MEYIDFKIYKLIVMIVIAFIIGLIYGWKR